MSRFFRYNSELLIQPKGFLMPKIEVNEKLFFSLLGETCDYDTLEQRLVCGKAELDERPNQDEPAETRAIKIELNDTNRPDLWSTGGIARQLRLYGGGAHTDYSAFFSRPGALKDCGERIVTVDAELKDIRPFMTAFVISGKPIDDAMLRDIIQTQEKLCWNFGRKRRTISMGVYRSAHIRWPVHYRAVDPDAVSFVPLQCTQAMTCREILSRHPKGQEYGWILTDAAKFPLLTDDTGEIMSMAPIINSATLGAVQVGDSDLLVEMTGSDMPSLMLATNIVACDFADAGYTILPCRIEHPYETGFGKTITVPYYFQAPAFTSQSAVNRLLGSSLTEAEILEALGRMGNTAVSDGNACDPRFTVTLPPYRNDFLHEVDVIEDVMIGMGLSAFPPEKPRDFTIGRLSAVTQYSRAVKSLMTGLGYQEMIFNYLGSKRDFIERMNIDGSGVIEIANPMSENYQFVRPSIIASLLAAESVSGNAPYPHKIYEVGKIAYLCDEEVTGTRTRQSLGFLTASGSANFNDAASEVSALLHFLDCPYTAVQSDDPRFIPGRQAALLKDGRRVGVFGEVHPAVLENWAITTPCAAGEIDIEALMQQQSAPETERERAAGGPQKTDPAAYFNAHISLKTAKITGVRRHPDADKLYIETLDDGSGAERVIVSGLVPFMQPEELLGKTVIIADNLKPRKMRGVESRGMLLAADCELPDGTEAVEVLDCPWAPPGTPVVPEGADPAAAKPAKIDADVFFALEMTVRDNVVYAGGKPLTAAGKTVRTLRIADGSVR